MSTSRPINVHDKMPDRAIHGNTSANIRFLEETGVLGSGGRMLEIGSGKGELLHYLTTRGIDIQGVEIHEPFIEVARIKSSELLIHQVKGAELPFDSESFDTVMSFDVLEHIPDTDSHLVEVRRVLKPGGIYVLQSPNKWTNSVFETLRWKSFTKWRAHHCSLHSYRQFQRRFRQHGFDIEFYDIPIVTDYFKQKLEAYAGRAGLIAIAIVNPDKLPMPLRTGFYIRAQKR